MARVRGRGVGLFAVAALVACAKFTAEDPPDASSPDGGPINPADGAPAPGKDAGFVVACPNGVSCRGKCIPATDCAMCPDALLCRPTGTCVAACTDCEPAPIECWTCDKAQSNPTRTCEPATSTTFCLSGTYPEAAQHCDCNNSDVKNCPGASQVCVPRGSNDDCVTCGETGYATEGKPCKDGKTCDTKGPRPQCR